MKFLKSKNLASAAVLASVVGLAACGGGSSGGSSSSPDPDPIAEGTQAYVDANLELRGDFAEDVTLDSSNVYQITGEVNFLDGTTLTIPAGTTLYGSTGSSYLAINRGAMIMADGTADQPIIFTSAEDFAGTATATDQGQWGGLTILGAASANKGERTYEAGTQPYGPDGTATAADCPDVDTTITGWEAFCGDNDDNSGVLDYVIIRYSGFEVEVDQELNGLSLAGVGSGTQISNIAITGSADDGLELWGGRVSIDGIYISNAGDDSLDTDEGYRGTLSNVYVEQIVVDDEVDSRAIEADSALTDVNGTETAGNPASLPVLQNATLNTIGRAVRLREGTGYTFNNVQVNVQTSDFADNTDADYQANIAAIRISDQTTFDESNITIEGDGLGINNEAVSFVLNTTTAGDISVDGSVPSGVGLYRDQATTDYFRALTTAPLDVVGVNQAWVDEGFLSSEGTAFTATAASNNTVTGVDASIFDWVLNATTTTSIQTLSGDISTDTTLSADILYAINGEVNVTNGAVLTIPAGTTLFGATGSSYLAVNRGSQIIADGTAAEPIVFTSAQDIAGLNATGTEQGQWGGLTILGAASANKGERTYEAGTQLYGPDGTAVAADCPDVDTGITGWEAFCGDDDDNSGVLDYVVIRYSGFEVEVDQELNGLSLAGVGSGTQISNVAIIGSADDGLELWGGRVDIDGLYVSNNGDDSIDTDEGYRGTISNVYAEHVIVDDETDSRILEADSNNITSTTPNNGGNPISLVVLENAVLNAIGRVARLREGTGYIFNNVEMTVDVNSAFDDSNMDSVVGAAIRISNDSTFAEASIATAGPGLAIINNAAPVATADVALYRDERTADYFGSGTGNDEEPNLTALDAALAADADFDEVAIGATALDVQTTTLNITPYDFSWAEQ